MGRTQPSQEAEMARTSGLTGSLEAQLIELHQQTSKKSQLKFHPSALVNKFQWHIRSRPSDLGQTLSPFFKDEDYKNNNNNNAQLLCQHTKNKLVDVTLKCTQ